MTNELTVRVQNSVIPAMSWNKDEVQQNLDELLAAYTGLVYTPESIKGAKDDRAKINSWDKQLGAAVTAARKLYLKPLEDFQADIKTMREQCKKVSGAIDAQVKAVEDLRPCSGRKGAAQSCGDPAGGTAPHPRDLRRGCRTLHHRIPEVSERQRCPA